MINQSRSHVMSMPAWPSVVAVALMLSLSGIGGWIESRASGQEAPCVGDCNHDGRLTIDELVTGVSMALGMQSLDSCPDFDRSGNHAVTVDELIAAVDSALTGCGWRTNRAPRASDVSFSADPV